MIPLSLWPQVSQLGFPMIKSLGPEKLCEYLERFMHSDNITALNPMQ